MLVCTELSFCLHITEYTDTVHGFKAMVLERLMLFLY